MKLNNKAFTLVEIITVVGILGLLAALAIPNFIKARETALKNICIANMKQVYSAVELWACDESKQSGETPEMDDLVPDYIKRWPRCSGTPYAIPAVGDYPTCPQDTDGHTL